MAPRTCSSRASALSRSAALHRLHVLHHDRVGLKQLLGGAENSTSADPYQRTHRRPRDGDRRAPTRRRLCSPSKTQPASLPSHWLTSTVDINDDGRRWITLDS
jgi:hypothetical protein